MGRKAWVLVAVIAFCTLEGCARHITGLKAGRRPLQVQADSRTIVTVGDAGDLELLKAMCSPSQSAFARAAKPLALADTCYLGPLCQNFYSQVLLGAVGQFNEDHVAVIDRCLGGNVSQVFNDQLLSTNRGNPTGAASSSASAEVPVVSAFAVTPDQAQTAKGSLDQILAPKEKVQPVPPSLWNLDFIDQETPPLNGKYVFGANGVPGVGSDVTIYVIDQGINPNHQEFLNPITGQSRAATGPDFVDGDGNGEDCDGHGTLIASIAAGAQTGVAKLANVVGVRVLDCKGTGNISSLISGLDYVAKNAQKPAVVVMSLGFPVAMLGVNTELMDTLRSAVQQLVTVSGITAVVAGGQHFNIGPPDSCVYVPANVEEAITVGAIDLANRFDASNQTPDLLATPYEWGNTGKCIDVFAPGKEVWAACHGAACKGADVSDQQYATAEGTSVAAPLVAGVAATYLGQYPDAQPTEVKDAIMQKVLKDRIDNTGDVWSVGTPNNLLYSRIFD